MWVCLSCKKRRLYCQWWPNWDRYSWAFQPNQIIAGLRFSILRFFYSQIFILRFFHSQIFILRFFHSQIFILRVFHSQIFILRFLWSQILEITPNTNNENLRIKKSETNYSLVKKCPVFNIFNILEFQTLITWHREISRHCDLHHVTGNGPWYTAQVKPITAQHWRSSCLAAKSAQFSTFSRFSTL